MFNFPQKTLMAAAIFAVLSPAAMAEGKIETTIYGFLNGQIESVEAPGGATPYQGRGRVSDGNSRIGFSGAVVVNPQIKGIWQIEGALNGFEQGGVNDNGKTGTLESRNTFVGIASDRFGRFIIGNNDSVYRSLVGSGSELGGNLGMTVHGLDLWNNTSAQLSGNSDSVFSRGEARYKNSFHYLSPVTMGVQAGASYGFDEARTGGSSHSRYSLGAKYVVGGFSIGTGYDHQANTGVDIDHMQKGLGFQTASQDGLVTSYAKVLASYKFPSKTYVGLGFEQATFGFQAMGPSNPVPSSITGKMKQNSALLSLAQDVGDASFMAGYAKMGNLRNTTYASSADFASQQVSLGLSYNLDRNLMPYLYFTKIRNQAQANSNLGQSPLRSNGLGSDSAYLAPGDSPRAFGIGLMARF